MLHLRDYPPEELKVWLKHAESAKARGGDYRSMLQALHKELMEKGFIGQGCWDTLLEDIERENKGAK